MQVLRFFVTHNKWFIRVAVVLFLIFVIDILILSVFFWGVVFGIGIINPNEVSSSGRDGCSLFGSGLESLLPVGWFVGSI